MRVPRRVLDLEIFGDVAEAGAQIGVALPAAAHDGVSAMGKIKHT